MLAGCLVCNGPILLWHYLVIRPGRFKALFYIIPIGITEKGLGLLRGDGEFLYR